MKHINKIIISTKETGYKIDDKSILGEQNSAKRVRANRVVGFFNKSQSLSTSFEYANGFIKDATSDNPDDTKISYVYKQWDIEIYTIPNPQQTTYVEDQYTDIILSMVKYQIIYKDPSTSELTYYNCHEDLQTNYFYELRENVLILHVSFSIKKSYDGEDLKIPEVKLRVSVNNSKVINN